MSRLSNDVHDYPKDRFEVIVELLDALQALPSDVAEVKSILRSLEHNHELCYAVLKEQGWLLKDQQLRLKNLEAHSPSTA